MAVVLALSASASIGLADFLGGLFSRRLPVATVTLFSQTAGLVAVAILAVSLSATLDGRAVALGALAGMFAATGLAAYYRALSVGTMSIVAPLSACGALIPFGLALGEGERPSALALAGVLLALGGAVLASFQEHRGGGFRRVAIGLALLTAVMFGLLFYVFGKASREGGALSALLGARAGTLGALALGVAVLRPALRGGSPSLLAAIALVGVIGAAGNGLFGLAAERSFLSIVSVLVALYPVTTILLAHLVLRERLTAIQRTGVLVALGGVSLVVTG